MRRALAAGLLGTIAFGVLWVACTSFSASPASPDASAEGGSAALQQYVAAVLKDGPIAYWHMDIASGLTIPDETNNGHDLILQGSGWTLGAAGAISGSPSIHFDGAHASAIATLSDAFAFDHGAKLSIECWASWDGASAGQSDEQSIISQIDNLPFDGGYTPNGFNLYVTRSAASTHFSYWHVHGGADLQGTIPSGFVHYVATFHGNNANLYVNGTMITPNKAGGTIDPRMSPFTVGASSAGGLSFPGSIDELAVYDQALTLAQVAAHLQAAGR
jgi:Concanavalin A-like lectin/glucanases superfamily